jgi:hypothetical protein
MTDIEAKALALVNEVRAKRGWEPLPILYRANYESDSTSEALCRAIEQLEAYKQEVSDAAEEVVQRQGKLQALLPFIIPKPKPDPLVDVAESLGYFNTAAQGWAGDVRAALDAAGLEIRPKEQ